MKKLLILLLTLMGNTLAQEFSTNQLYENYDNYRDLSIIKKKFTHAEFVKSLEQYRKYPEFKFQLVGKSMEDREIYMITFGTGSTHILAWSQMHGDESTATMALLDVLNFFSSSDEFDNLRKEILSRVTVHIIPMLNPDGAQKFKRRNFLDIDINRDAARLQFPESQILKSVRDSINPQFGFNLHDQSTRYTVGDTYKSAALSFLAPAFNFEKEINIVRQNAMKVISDIYNQLNNFIPGHIAKYNDDFEPRAFGDNMMKWGTSSILIESGGWKNNFDKQFIRKLNFVAIITGFESIAFEKYRNANVEVYNQINENKTKLFDLLLRNLTVEIKNKIYKIDLGINYSEVKKEQKNGYYFAGRIDDIGDLSTFYGYDEFDFQDYKILPGKLFTDKVYTEQELENVNFTELFRNGFTAIQSEVKSRFTNFPINIVVNSEKYNPTFLIGSVPDFQIIKDGKLKYILVNGFLYDFNSGINKIPNGVVIK